MIHKLSILLIVGLCFGLVLSSPLQDTNAQRLARGLPPIPPKFARGIIGARNKPTPAQGSKRATTSPLPPVTLTGRLELRNKDGSSLGHVRNWQSGGTISGVNALGPDKDLLVSLTFSPSNPKFINILATNPAFPAPFFVGGGTSSTVTVPSLSLGSRSTVPFTNVESTPPGSLL
ncbi:hypothetical protein BDZ97DRAFT_500664 [Flammula alnicola]|nr:hypothetical protein BDZ97DRAFT_500664 [Flammula alnicola]